MFCHKCGAKIDDASAFCLKCGVKTPSDVASGGKAVAKAEKKTTGKAAKTPAPVAQPQPAPQPVAPAQPVAKIAPNALADVKTIKSPPKILSLKETIDFKGAETALENEGLKTKAFAGFFSSPLPTEVRVDLLVKIYEPIHMVRAVYEGTFEVMKDFNLSLDPGTTKLVLDGKTYDITEVASGGAFGGSSAPLKLTGMETVKKRVEKAVYYDMNGVQKNNIQGFVQGKPTVSFDSGKTMPRCQVLGTNFSALGLTDKVLTPDIVQRMQNAKNTVDERITVDIQTIYYPKYKATVTSLKNNQQKYLVFSAVDKQVMGTETF